MNSESFIFIKPGEIRVRIAPSPTGFLHIGTARTALFNYLFAKRNNGSFVLRIEDTDRERSKLEYENDIIDNLKWLGIQWSEGPDVGGNFGPYRQSERKDIYHKYIKRLLSEGKAYYCFCSSEELEALKQYQISIGESPHYNRKCANLSSSKVKEYLSQQKPYVIRFRMPSLKSLEFKDIIRGDLNFDPSVLDDIIIARDESTPLYNLAVVIDDFEMKISHIIRGEDHLSNTPKQIILQKALGFPQPQYAHLPLILGPDKSKLSKRHGATAISYFKEEGYLPETMVNFMAFLGWNPGDEREIYSLNSLAKEFSLERVQKGGAIFNIKRLNYLNGFYIRQKSIKKLTELCLPYLIKSGLIAPEFKEIQYPPAYGGKEVKQVFRIMETKEYIEIDYLEKIVSVYRERLKKISEISELTEFFFKDKLIYDKDLLKWREMTDNEVIASLDKLEKVLSKIKDEYFNKDYLEKTLLIEAEKFIKGIKREGDRGYFLWPLRVALSGKKSSATPFEIAEILGKQKTLKRIREAKELF